MQLVNMIWEVIDLAYINFLYSFIWNNIISVWNSLPDLVVSADTVDAFRVRLDRVWLDQEIKYNWKADIRIGNRKVDVILD